MTGKSGRVIRGGKGSRGGRTGKGGRGDICGRESRGGKGGRGRILRGIGVFIAEDGVPYVNVSILLSFNFIIFAILFKFSFSYYFIDSNITLVTLFYYQHVGA